MAMKYFKTIIIYVSLCCYFTSATAQFIQVDDSKGAQELIENILVNSSCATILNPIAKGDTFSGAKKSYGYFNAGTSNFPFVQGVLLSTGSSSNSTGPFTTNRDLGNTSWLGDPDLEQALNLTKTFNASFLEFDFIPLTNLISFNYIFASNEYQDYFPCEFSDGFAFLIKEKGSAEPYKNIAVLPNSTTPVSSTNVHPLIPSFNSQNGLIKGCPPINENYFNGYNTNTSPINYSAQTVVLNAQSSVIAGRTYHIKLVIADDKNAEYDSAVFIEAGSFSPKINLGLDQTVCFGDQTVIDTGLTNSTYTYEWSKDGIIDPLQNTNTYTVTNPGNYAVNVTIAGTCTAQGKVNINYAAPIKKTLIQCGDSSGNAKFDLTQLSSIINGGNTDIVDYYEIAIDQQNQTPKIANPSAYISTSRTIYARVTNTTGGCTNYTEITLQVLSTLTPIQTLSFCDTDGNQDGIRLFDLKRDINPKILPVIVAPLLVQGYYLNATDAANKTDPINTIYTNLTNPQIIFARIENGIDCYGIYEIALKIIPYNTIVNSIITDVIISDFNGNKNSVLIETSGVGNYEYSLDGTLFQSDSLFTNVKTGIYTVYVRDNLSCGLSTRMIYVLDYPRFFTPNGDGYNDFWRINNLNLFPNATVTIFDRYGKLLKQLNQLSNSWDGTFNRVALPADDYWFNINFGDEKNIKGHFSLKR